MRFAVVLGLCLTACAHPAPEASESDAGPAPPARDAEPAVNPNAWILALDAAVLPTAETAETAETAMSSVVPHREPGLCQLLCMRSAYLNCPAADSCVARCNEMRTMVSCSEAIKSMFQCYLKAPSGAWKCNARGVAALPPDVCPQEQARALDCLSP
jgi:hypothetical protein